MYIQPSVYVMRLQLKAHILSGYYSLSIQKNYA